MVAKAGRYYGTVFQGAGGVTQGDPISPTIFSVVVEDTEERGDHGQEGRHQSDLFYVDDDMVVLSDPHWI